MAVVDYDGSNYETVLMDRAKRAARQAIARLSVDLSIEDVQDVEAAAMLGFHVAWTRKPGNVGYAYIAARNEAVKFIIRDLFGRNPMSPTPLEKVEHYLAARHAGQRGPLPDDVKRELFGIFIDSRVKKGERGTLATARDVFILNTLAQEGNNAGIGMALDCPPSHIKQYRRRIREVLEDQLRERRL